MRLAHRHAAQTALHACVALRLQKHCAFRRLAWRTKAPQANMSAESTGRAFTNRLAKEESPYLLQHAHNPVDWFPWGKEAFDRAKALDLPIFLSVGYSTCHWCHVMERESFESEEIAQIINERFVSIKVDREERPDVDRVYMTYVQAISGGGGWPMSVFLTPSLEPIVGGTYFPPEDKYGRPGFKTVLKKVSQAWQKDKSTLQNQGTRVMSSIAEAISSQEPEVLGTFGPASVSEAIETAFTQLSDRFDKENGGFSNAPKFPRVSEINLVLLQHLIFTDRQQKEKADSALHMASLTLKTMAAGGIYDHLGGGFARYSVDEKWHVPHFEKMLYDNPQIVQTYLAAFQSTGDRAFARVSRGVLDYLLRDMRHPDGGFYSAEDADSLDHVSGNKKEGEFYVWTKSEVDTALGASDSQLATHFAAFYHIHENGNTNLSRMRAGFRAVLGHMFYVADARLADSYQSILSDPHGEFVGKNVLINLDQRGLDEEEPLSEAREKLHAQRAKRPRPHLDDKIVSAWNGMAIGAFASASVILAKESPQIQPTFPVDGRDPEDYLQAAIKAAEFVEEKLWMPEKKRLRRSFCRGPSDVEGFDSDYAFLIAGLLDLFAANGDTKWLKWAYELQDSMDALFWDSKSGAYFSTTGQDSSIKLRMKEDQDGAEPAASSVAVSNLLRLAALAAPDKGTALRDRAVKTLAAFSERLVDMPMALTQMCCSAYLLQAEPIRQVIIAGSRESARSLLNAAHSVFCPDKVVIALDPSSKADTAFWQKHNPEVSAMVANTEEGAATAFICQNFSCQAPTSDSEKVKALLSSQQGANKGQTTINVQDLGISDLK